MKNYSIRKICIMGLFTAVSLGMFVVELAIPSVPFCPYLKLGLANTVTLFVLFLGKDWKNRDCAAILALRIVLGALLTGQLMTVIFSAAGGVLAFTAMIITKRITKGSLIPLVSISGAVFHNIGQIAAAVVIYGGFSVVYYLPLLTAGAIVSGTVNGMCVSLLYRAHPSFIENIRNNQRYL